MGWNTRDPISNMDETYAGEMENYFPAFGTVDLVRGYRYHSKSIGVGAVRALGVLKSTQYNKLVAVGDDNIVYDATTGSASATEIMPGATTLSLPPIYMQFFNDRLFLTSGSSATASDIVYSWTGTGDIASAAFTIGGNPAYGLGPMAAYRSRLYFLQLSTPITANIRTSLFYGGVDAVTGALTEFPFKSLLKLGGYGVFIGSVTRAKDFSEDELLCIISDQGEILVYQGDYPGSSTWGLIGHYFVPRPLGPKSFFYIGANLCIVTGQGVIPMSEVMGGTATGTYLTLSDAITPSFTDAATTTLLDNYAWCGVNYTRGNFAVVNIPVTANAVSNQFYMNTKTQAWCKRSNQNAFCWTIFNDELYFGGLNGRVFKADNGYFDEDPASEGAVLSKTVKVRSAFNYFGDREKKKQFVAAIPTIYQSEGMDLTMDVDVDFGNTTATSRETDSTDTAYKLYQPTMGLKGIGDCASIRIDGTVTTKRSSWQATKVIWNDGDIQ